MYYANWLRRSTPVVLHCGFYCQQQEGHDGVADGELGGGPRHPVIAQLEHAAGQEVMSRILAHLEGGRGQTQRVVRVG